MTTRTETQKIDMTKEMMESLLGNTLPTKEETDTQQTAKSTAKVSAAQLKFYHDLCAQKNEPVVEKEWTTGELGTEINRLKTLPYWKACSENQIARITELCTSLNMPLPKFEMLNGAYGESASKMIQTLKDMAKNVVLPISEKQLAMVIQMNFCPDVEPIDEPDKLSQKEASEHIAKFKDSFYAWKKTRLSPDQAKLIEVLTERLGSKLPYSAIIQFDEGTAHQYIDQLEKELADKSLVDTSLEQEDMYGIDTKDKEDVRNELRNIVAKLYASIGQELEEEVYETLSWSSLKELIEFVKPFGVDVKAMFDRCTIFNAEQIDALLG
jgi:hypothetical protein